MKTLLTLLFCGLVCSSCFGQNKLSSADWQSDLLFLQKTVHKDYAFLFKKIKAEDFDAEVKKFHDAIPNLQEHEIVAGFGRMVASFKYGHTDLGWTGSPIKFHIIPASLYWFNDGIYIEGVQKSYPPNPRG